MSTTNASEYTRISKETSNDRSQIPYDEPGLQEAFRRGLKARIRSKSPIPSIQVSDDEWSRAWQRGYRAQAKGSLERDR